MAKKTPSQTPPGANRQPVPRPAKVLATDPAIESEQHAELALRELSWIDAETARVKALTDAAVNAAKAGFADLLTIGRNRLPFKDRVARLNQALIDFAGRAKSRLLDGDRKTATFTSGELRYQEQREVICVADESATKAVHEAVRSELQAAMDRLRVKGIPVAEIFDVNVTLNFTRAMDAATHDRVTAKQLATAGLKRFKPEEKILIKPAKYVVTSASAESDAA